MIAQTEPTQADAPDWPALIAALQIRADHHADVIARLVEVIARARLAGRGLGSTSR
jgi:hypothetical protein